MNASYTITAVNPNINSLTVRFFADAAQLQQDVPVADFTDETAITAAIVDVLQKFANDIAAAEAATPSVPAPLQARIGQNVSVPITPVPTPGG